MEHHWPSGDCLLGYHWQGHAECSHYLCVCVCVCVCERERERERGCEGGEREGGRERERGRKGERGGEVRESMNILRPRQYMR